jgi:hypothetical protein
LSKGASHEESVRRFFSRDFEELAREALESERNTVIGLRNEEAINDEVLRRIRPDIDVAEARPPAAEITVGQRTRHSDEMVATDVTVAVLKDIRRWILRNCPTKRPTSW